MSAAESITMSASLDSLSIIAICAFAAVILILAILALVALFQQKKLLAEIRLALLQKVPSAAAPAPNTCRACGAVYTPGSAFCQNCGAAL